MFITAVQNGLSTSAIGLLIVFVVLIILLSIIYLLKYIGGGSAKKEADPIPSGAVEAVPPEAVIQSAVSAAAPDRNEAELVAAITAAIAAHLGTSPDRLVVRSFRKAPAWIDAAKREQQTQHTMIIIQ